MIGGGLNLDRTVKIAVQPFLVEKIKYTKKLSRVSIYFLRNCDEKLSDLLHESKVLIFV